MVCKSGFEIEWWLVVGGMAGDCYVLGEHFIVLMIDEYGVYFCY